MSDPKAGHERSGTEEAGELLTTLEAAQALGISQRTLQRLLEQGALKGSRVGRQWRFRREDLEAFLRRAPAAAAAPAADVEAALRAVEGGAEAPLLRVTTFSGSPVGAGADEGLVPEGIARLAHAILRQAVRAGASDLHVEPPGDGIRVRLRLDGVLHPVLNLPASLHESLILCFKQMAEMDLAERRLPQVGRCAVEADGREFDLRASCLPTVLGEKLVMRLLPRSVTDLLPGLDGLGLFPETLEQLVRIVHRPNGLLVVTGATGTGKTTTLYSLLLRINSVERNLMTIEDPVECLLPGIAQLAVNPKLGLRFASALRACFRSDPDVIMVAELRDLETAELACQAAMTGHLVLTALHTERAVEVPTRLIDMGMAPYLVAANVSGVLAQRLARKLCDACKAPGELSAELEPLRAAAAAGGFTLPRDAAPYRAGGCDRCRGTGYRGRIGLFELLEATSTVRGALLRRAPEEEVEAIAIGQGMRTLAADGLRKAALGITTPEEVQRILLL